MKPNEKILTYEQAKELKWFCKNCTGLKPEFYELLNLFNKFKAKIDRLETTCQMIEAVCKEYGWNKVFEQEETWPRELANISSMAGDD